MIKQSTSVPNINVYVIRLKPGSDLKMEIDMFCKTHSISAGWIAAVVGSLSVCSIRFANQKAPYSSNEFYEIVGLTGTISESGSHLHILLTDKNGSTLGGHLLKGCLIYTTAEIVIQTTNKYIFTRQKDDATGFNELNIQLNEG